MSPVLHWCSRLPPIKNTMDTLLEAFDDPAFEGRNAVDESLLERLIVPSAGNLATYGATDPDQFNEVSTKAGTAR